VDDEAPVGRRDAAASPEIRTVPAASGGCDITIFWTGLTANPAAGAGDAEDEPAAGTGGDEPNARASIDCS
jgi:hypothetical protein